MKFLKAVANFFVVLLCGAALHDILKGQENPIDELIILFLGGVWLVYLIKPFKFPKFFKLFLLFLIFVVLHNVISHLLGFEEAIFFSLSLLALAISIILILIEIVQWLKLL